MFGETVQLVIEKSKQLFRGRQGPLPARGEIVVPGRSPSRSPCSLLLNPHHWAARRLLRPDSDLTHLDIEIRINLKIGRILKRHCDRLPVLRWCDN